jgi:chitin disaccharide deacetylase
LTAASLMAGEPWAGDAVARAKRLPGLRVGLHLVLVEGRPVLPPEQVPDLVDGDGVFRRNMVRAGVNFFFRPAVRRQLAAEIEAQFQAFAATGLALDHVNAHKHFHLHPTIAGLMLDIGRRHGAKAMRVPLEPVAVLSAIEAGPRRGAGPGPDPSPDPSLDPSPGIIGLGARRLRRRLRRAGMTTPDQVFGLAWSGAMTAPRLAGILARLPEGLTEIYLHPATAGGFRWAAPGYRYAEELAALTDGAVIAAAGAAGITRGGFTDFTAG